MPGADSVTRSCFLIFHFCQLESCVDIFPHYQQYYAVIDICTRAVIASGYGGFSQPLINVIHASRTGWVLWGRVGFRGAQGWC